MYAVIDLGGFTQAHLDTIKVGETGYVYMTTTKGLVLAYPPNAKEIMKLDVSGFEFGEKMIEMKNGVLSYAFEGVSKITAFNEVGKTGWIVVATAPADEVFAEAYGIRRLLMITGAIAQTMEATMQNTSMVAAAASTINEIAKNSEEARSISA